jgi:hypothetical protein
MALTGKAGCGEETSCPYSEASDNRTVPHHALSRFDCVIDAGVEPTITIRDAQCNAEDPHRRRDSQRSIGSRDRSLLRSGQLPAINAAVETIAARTIARSKAINQELG